MSDNIKFANQFIDLWQENFEKMLASGENMRQMQQVLESMKGFYAKSDQSAAATDSATHSDGDIAELVRALSRRVDELEQRLNR